MWPYWTKLLKKDTDDNDDDYEIIKKSDLEIIMSDELKT